MLTWVGVMQSRPFDSANSKSQRCVLSRAYLVNQGEERLLQV